MIFRTEHVMGQTTFLQYNILYVVYIKLICLCRKMACKDRSASVILSYLFRNSPSPVDSSTLTSLPRHPGSPSAGAPTPTLFLSLLYLSLPFFLSPRHTQSPHTDRTMSPARETTRLASLPIINLDPYLNPTDGKGRISTAAALHAACLQYGFFYLDISNYVDPSEPEELTRLAREFFAQSDEEKSEIALGKQDGARGM